MALLSLIFDRPKKTKINVAKEDGTERELLILDMVTNTSHTNEASPTEHPIETGAVISDHVDVLPKIVSFDGLMSSAPISGACRWRIRRPSVPHCAPPMVLAAWPGTGW